MTNDENFEKDFDGVFISSKRMYCALHGEPFRERYPMGVPIFTVKAFQIVSGLDSFTKRVSELSGKPIGELDPKLMAKALDEKPLCCWLSPDQLVGVYRECDIGVLAICNACGARRFGTRYITRAQTFKHLCFQCVSRASATPQTTS